MLPSSDICRFRKRNMQSFHKINDKLVCLRNNIIDTFHTINAPFPVSMCVSERVSVCVLKRSFSKLLYVCGAPITINIMFTLRRLFNAYLQNRVYAICYQEPENFAQELLLEMFFSFVQPKRVFMFQLVIDQYSIPSWEYMGRVFK